jgi:hypothetical protein
MNLLHVNAALQTVRAGRVELFLVWIFGSLRTELDGEGKEVKLRKWRGRSYMVDYRQVLGES